MTEQAVLKKPLFNSRISLKPLADILKQMIAEGKPGARKLYGPLIQAVEKNVLLLDSFEDADILRKESEIIEMLLATLFPPSGFETDSLYAICYPFRRETIYASPAFRGFFHDTDDHFIIIPNEDTGMDLNQEALHLAYNLILRNCYSFKLPFTSSSVHKYHDEESGLTRYLELKMDARYVAVKCNGKELPTEEEVISFHSLPNDEKQRLLPLEDFQFEGLTIINIEDVTPRETISELKNSLLGVNAFSDASVYETLQDHIQTLLGSREIVIGITPFFKMNNYSLFSEMHTQNSLLFKTEKALEEKTWVSEYIQELFKSTNQPIFIEDLSAATAKDEFLHLYLEQGIRSLLVCPLKSDNGLVGLLEVGARKQNELNMMHVARIESAVPLFTIALERSMENLEMQIDRKIKESFTAVQSAVEWKFTEAAFQYIQQKQLNANAKIPPIVFEDVYPLYGAIDIRNSSEKRSTSIQLDLVEQLQLAKEVVGKARKKIQFPLLKEVEFKIDKYLSSEQGHLIAEDEMVIHDFLKEEVYPIFSNLETNMPELKEFIDVYIKALDPQRKMIYRKRKDYEDSITRINDTLEAFMEHEQVAAQRVFPHYFEHYVTDGVEFNIYIGQSMSPTFKFDEIYVRNLKIWQLNVLVKAARLAHSLEKKLPMSLQTTQLILAQSTPISISFRSKERKFDVDGAYNMRYEIITALREIAALHPDQLMVVAMHHPMYSFGVHGGNYTLRHHLFPFTEAIPWLYIPLPIIGSIYPIARGVFGNIQDVKHPLYRTMINQIEDVLKEHPNAIHVSGHDHSLQMLMKDSIPYIISGSALDVSRVKTGKTTLYADASLGFAMLEVRKSGKVESKFYTLNSANLDQPSYKHELKQVIAKERTPPKDTAIDLPDSMAVAANPDLQAGGFKRFLMGDNYREEWATPVKVQVLDISKERGGLTPTKRGGGKQTKSLRLEDKNGNEYALRSIQKFPEEAIPADLRFGVAKDIVQDGISASYPYGSLSYAPLAKALNIPVIDRKLVYVPDDPRLGRFRIDFANTLCVLEEREPAGTKKTYNSEELVLRMLKDHDDHIDQKLVLTARLLDNFIMDFDRHEDQWRWATYDTGKGKMYYPIPRDHDQMFFINDGFIPNYAKKPWLIPQIQGFKPKAHNIKTFNFAARNFDRAFMSELTEEDWKTSIDTFLMKLTDSVLVASLRRQPNEIMDISGDKIINTMKKRKKHFKEDMMEYYEFISKIVNVVGTNQDEKITVTRNDNGSVLVQVNTLKDDSTTSLIYERLFDPKVTKEVRIYGMGDNDKFVFQGVKNKNIKIRVIGGTGDDEFYNESENAGRTRVYDVNFENNKFFGNEMKTKINSDPTNNKYERLYYRYDKFQPGLGVGYNPDDGVLLSGRVRYTRYGFRKDPYSMHHDLRITRAFSTGAYNIKYNGEFIDAIGKADLVLRADIKGPNNTSNFFGLGNETIFDESKGISFYRSRYNMRDAALMLRHRMQSWMDILYGATFQHYSIDSSENSDRILGKPSQIGLDSTRTYINKSYAGLIGAMTIDTRNSEVLPTRGLFLTTYARTLFGTKNGAYNITQLNWDMRLFISIVEETKIVFATRFGVGHNIGDYEFYQAQYLSGIDNLRGYRKDRFAGKTMVYFNNELRFKITDFSTYLFPGSLGLVGFYDLGRVWVENDNSNQWHGGYGGGIWISPLRRFVGTFSVGVSKEEVVPYLSFGFQF